MFLRFYGLSEQPFGVTPDPRFLFVGPEQQEALSSLVYGIEMGRGFMALIASPGLGKTTILLQLMERLRHSARTAFLFQTHTSPHEFLRSLLTDLEIDPVNGDLGDLQRQLGEVLIAEAKAERRIVLAIDEAQNLDDQLLETVRTLSNFETPQAKLLQIILVGQPQLADKLAAPHLEQLRQRISIITHFPPLRDADVPKYIDHRLRVAGYKGPGLFAAAALHAIVTYSKGIPRNINNLCFHALSLGFAKNEKIIGADSVTEVIADLRLESLGTESQAPAPALTPKPDGATEEAPRPAVFGRQRADASRGGATAGRAAAPRAGQAAVAVALDEDAVMDRVELASDAEREAEIGGRLFGHYAVPRAPVRRPARRSHASLVWLALAGVVAGLWAAPRLLPQFREWGAELGVGQGAPTVIASVPAPAAAAPATLAVPRNTPAPAGHPDAALPAEPVGAGSPAPGAAEKVDAPAPAEKPASPAPLSARASAAGRTPGHGPREALGAADTYAPDSGRLVVEANVGGGNITVNGQSDPKWKTPHVFHLPPGTYVVTVFKSGYVDWTGRIHLDAGREHYLMAKMESNDDGVFAVETDPPGMQVFIDGKPYGPSRVETTLRPGWHVCKVIPRPGEQAVTSRFELKAGEMLTRKIRMVSPESSWRGDRRQSAPRDARLNFAGGLP